MEEQEKELRKQIAQTLLERQYEDHDWENEIDEKEITEEFVLEALPEAPDWPSGLAPRPQPISPRPGVNDPLPEADVIVITWTIAELNALCDVLTPGFARNRWYRYARNFDENYSDRIRNGAPAARSRRLGSYFMTEIGDLKVLCFKSELHLNQDGINLTKTETDPTAEKLPRRDKRGFATLPVKTLFEQLIDEVKPRYVLTTGTSGAVYLNHDLGDVVVTRGAKFRLSDEFRSEPFNGMNIEGAQYKSEWNIPRTHFSRARSFMNDFKSNLVEPDFGTPTKRFNDNPGLITAYANNPDIKLDGDNMPEFHPILSTDFFEFGTSANNMEEEGSAVEMGDAVLGLVCEEMDNPPKWLVLRNVSDPQINADLPTNPINMQIHWAVWYYVEFGYWTSVNSAFACWAVIAGINDEK